MKVLIAAKERKMRDQMRQIVQSTGRYEVAGTAMDGQEAVQLAVLLKPDFALINAELPIFDGYEAAEMIGLAVPEVRTVLVSDKQPDNLTLQKAMRSGLRSYISSPVDGTELMEAIDNLAALNNRRTTSEYLAATDPSRLPKVIVVTGGKGGIGKSTIAASLAMCLARRHPEKVVLFDLYTQFGDIATMLNVSPTKTLAELVSANSEIDLELLEHYLLPHETGLKVLVSAVNAQPIDAISVAGAEAVIHALKRTYTHIIIDLPPVLHSTTLYVLSHCYHLLLITTLFDMPTLRDGRQLYDMVVGNYIPAENISVIVNRVSKHDKLSISDVERIFGRQITAQVPNDHRLVSAINQGVPFVQAYARSPLVSAVNEIADMFTEQRVKGRK